MNKKYLKNIFFHSIFVRISLITLLLVFFLTILFLSISSYLKIKQDKKIDTIIDTLTYAEHNVDSELHMLESYTDKLFLSNKANAKLYKALAEISYMTGNHSLYNEYMANAFYYTELIHDTESVIYLTNKYIGLLYANGCFEAAEKILQNISINYDIQTFSINIQASYYLSCADVAQMLNKENTHALDNARSCIERMEKSAEKKLLQAKLDLLTARNYIQSPNYDLAKEILSKYDESVNFGLDAEQVYVVCDFQIPYYEITSKILLNDGNITEAYKYIDLYLTACDDYNFRGMKLRMLQYVDDYATKDNTEKYLILKNQTISENLTEMTNQYGNFLLSDMDKESSEKREQAQKLEAIIQTVITKTIFVYIVFFVYYIILFIVDCANRDELTGLYNRRKYQFFLESMARKHSYYTILVLDIDNFKKVNDTHGHQCGDSVLCNIGKILQGYNNKNIYAFRYGGEELCVLFIKIPEAHVREIAEEIRLKIYHTVSTEQITITVSGGIATSFTGEDVFPLADERLYKAKSNGKNQII